MDIVVNFIVGLLIVPLYNWIKGKLGLEGKPALWVIMGLLFLLAVPVTLLTGGLSGIIFDAANPVGFLRGCGQAFLVMLGTAEGYYLLFFKKDANKKK